MSKSRISIEALPGTQNIQKSGIYFPTLIKLSHFTLALQCVVLVYVSENIIPLFQMYK